MQRNKCSKIDLVVKKMQCSLNSLQKTCKTQYIVLSTCNLNVYSKLYLKYLYKTVMKIFE